MALLTRIEGITSESQELVDMYLQANEKSARTIISALRRLIEETNKNDVTDINYKDCISYVKPFENDKTPAKLKREFIKFLYGYDFLKDKSGFKDQNALDMPLPWSSNLQNNEEFLVTKLVDEQFIELSKEYIDSHSENQQLLIVSVK